MKQINKKHLNDKLAIEMFHEFNNINNLLLIL